MLMEGRPPCCRRLKPTQLLHVYILLSALLSTVTSAKDLAMIALMLPQTGTTLAKANNTYASGVYFPLANAVQSAMRLAVDDMNELGSSMEGSLSLAMLEVDTVVGAVEGLCNALQAVGDNGTYGVLVPPVSSQASALEVVSNSYFALPMVTPSAFAARAMSYDAGGVDATTDGTSFLFGIQPDIFEQMNALVKLILDMKTERDTERGWYFEKERVFVLHTYDEYGSIAAAAFSRAARQTIGINVGFNAGGYEDSTVEIVSMTSVSGRAEEDFQEPLVDILNKGASIVVLLADGFDGRFIRRIFSQARDVGMVNENVQWYLNDVSVMDSVFTVNDTYHDSQLAYDMRGLMGVRSCPPTKGPGRQNATRLTEKWELLDGGTYPGAGPGTLTPDGRIDPLIAFSYDSVLVMALAIRSAQESAKIVGGELHGFVGESCPYPSDGMWKLGYAVRTAALESDFPGVTGTVRFHKSGSAVTNAAGTAGAGWRNPNGTTFCGFNLQSHASLGGTFVAIKEWRPDLEKNLNDTDGFENISDFQKKQSYPSGGTVYPFDRPTLRDTHITVVTEETASPFAVVTGLEEKSSDYKGITLDTLQAISVRLGFTYDVTVVNSTVSKGELIDYIADGVFDMVASRTTITVDRLDRVSFSFPFYNTRLSFVYRQEIDTKVSYWKMLKPFDIHLWATIVGSTMIVLLLLWVFDGNKNDQFARKKATASGTRRQILKGISLTTYVTGALLLGQMLHEPETLESFLITSGWILTCFILAASFTAELTSFLSAETPEPLSFGLDDILEGTVPHSQVALRQGTTFQQYYETKIMKCYSVAECSKGGVMNTPVPCYSQDECLELVQNGTAVVTLDDTVAAEYRVSNDYCSLDVLAGSFNDENYGFVLPKDTPYLLEFEQAIVVLREDGTLAKISASYLDSSKCDYIKAYNASSAASQNLTLIDMGGVFMVLGIFVGASFVTWIFRRSPLAKTMWRRYFARREAIASAKKTEALGFGEERSYPQESTKGLVPELPLQTIVEHNVEGDSEIKTNHRRVFPLITGSTWIPRSKKAYKEWEGKTEE